MEIRKESGGSIIITCIQTSRKKCKPKRSTWKSDMHDFVSTNTASTHTHPPHNTHCTETRLMGLSSPLYSANLQQLTLMKQEEEAYKSPPHITRAQPNTQMSSWTKYY